LIAWISYLIFQKKGAPIRPFNFILAIVLSAVLFGIGHLPVVFALTADVTPTLIFYIVSINTIFGLIAGTLYWKYGLEAAIGAHMIAHITMVIAG